jgi:hypothetical protein
MQNKSHDLIILSETIQGWVEVWLLSFQGPLQLHNLRKGPDLMCRVREAHACNPSYWGG